jgi:hypothetical protein
MIAYWACLGLVAVSLLGVQLWARRRKGSRLDSSTVDSALTEALDQASAHHRRTTTYL